VKDSTIGADEIQLYKSNDHHRNLIDCIKTRGRTAAPVEVGHRSTSVCHLGNIAMTLSSSLSLRAEGKRKLRWDPDNERFIDDEQANRMLSRSMRSPWSA